MKKTFNVFLAGLCIFLFAACEAPRPIQGGNETEQNGTADIFKKDFPFVEEYPIECGNLIAEGSEVGVTIEVTKVEDNNFVFELRPGPMVQSFRMDVYPLAQLYNNLLNDNTFGYLKAPESWAVNERIRSYLFNESGSGGYAFSIDDFDDPDDFLQIRYDWMNTSYAAASAIAIPDCGYVIAVVASVETEISSVTQEDLTLCYVHTSSQPLVGDPQCEIEVNTGYRAFGVQHHLNADAAAVYFFGYLTSEIDAYIDAFGDTLFRDFMRTRVTAPSYPDDPNNPESLYYSVNYGDEADASILSTTCAVAVDANLTPQEDYSRSDFHLKEIPEEQPEAKTSFYIPEERIGAHYAEFQINFDKETRSVHYLFYNQDQVAEYNAMSDKDKRQLARDIANKDGYGCNNPNFLWDAEKEVAIGTDASVYVEGVLECLAFQPGETYQVIYTSKNGFGTLNLELQLSEPFTMDELNFTSPDECKAQLKFHLDNPTRTSFRSNIEFDPETVSVMRLQYMHPGFNPGFWTDAPWDQWIDYIYNPQKYYDESNPYAPIINIWPTVSSGLDVFTWTDMTPDTEYTVYLCVEDFDGNISQMYFDSIKTSELQIGPDPTINMSLIPSKYGQGDGDDWTVTYEIDHDVEYFLYCYTDTPADLAAHMPGINLSHFNNVKESGYTYQQWYDGIYEWVAGGFEENGGGMRADNNTSLDFTGSKTVIAACIAVGRNENGSPKYQLFTLICKDGNAQTLEEIFGIE
ncbi:MAG: hypothetical protein IKZ08_01885 [Bacteroidales bacterium]|nr:hypothetical protein [Bacteroidales bacterium]MBR5862057.1 hypothetical protein [Bacteroidales bacterium]